MKWTHVIRYAIFCGLTLNIHQSLFAMKPSSPNEEITFSDEEPTSSCFGSFINKAKKLVKTLWEKKEPSCDADTGLEDQRDTPLNEKVEISVEEESPVTPQSEASSSNTASTSIILDLCDDVDDDVIVIIPSKEPQKETLNSEITRNCLWKNNNCWMNASLQVIAQMKPLVNFLISELEKKSLHERPLEKALAEAVKDLHRDQAEGTVNTDPLYGEILKQENMWNDQPSRGRMNSPQFFLPVLMDSLYRKSGIARNLSSSFSMQSTQLMFRGIREKKPDNQLYSCAAYLWFMKNKGPFSQETLNKIIANDTNSNDIIMPTFLTIVPLYNEQKVDESCKNIPAQMELWSSSAEAKKQGTKNSYSLYGIILFGNKHYTALVKQKNRCWYYYDDLEKKRTLISEKVLADFLQSNSYENKSGQLFFYCSSTQS